MKGKAHIKLQILCNTNIGQEVFVLGNCNELGSWNVSSYFKLAFSCY